MKWEYLVLLTKDCWEEEQDDLDKEGEEGWELVAVNNDTMYLKRPIEKQKRGEVTESKNEHGDR